MYSEESFSIMVRAANHGNNLWFPSIAAKYMAPRHFMWQNNAYMISALIFHIKYPNYYCSSCKYNYSEHNNNLTKIQELCPGIRIE
jgi:hypothetical protein